MCFFSSVLLDKQSHNLEPIISAKKEWLIHKCSGYFCMGHTQI